MEVTILGYIFIPVGLGLLFLNRDYLLYATVIFSGFTGASVMNVTSISFGLAPSYYFGTLFIIKYLIYIIKNKKIVKPNLYLTLFIIACYISILFTFFFCKSEIYVYGIGNGLKLKNAEFSMQNITQFMYLIFGFIIYWFIKDRLKEDSNFVNKLIKIYLFSGFIISIIGFYQVIAYKYELPFDTIFRSNPLGWQQGIRVYAVAAEPSMIAYFIVPTLALALLYKEKVLIIGCDKIFILLFIIGVLTTSTTFLVGILALFVIYLIKNINKPKKIFKYILAIILLIGIIILIFNFNPEIKIRLWDKSIAKFKLENGSGISRYEIFKHMMSVGFQYPLFGVGFGSGRSTDLYSSLFATTGVVGITLFISYILGSVFLLMKCMKRHYYKEISEGYIYFLVLFLVCSVSVPEFLFLFFWVNFGIIDSIILNYTIDKTNTQI